MTIHEAFAQYIVVQGDGPREAGQKAMAFKQLMDTLYNKLGPSWSFVMWMSFKGMAHARPQLLEAVWHSWGIDNVEQLIDFVNSFNNINVKEIIDDIAPFITVDLKSLQEINFSEIVKLTKEQCYCTSNMDTHCLDNKYYKLTQKVLDDLLQYSRLPQMQYIPEKRDCDDYSGMFKSWLSYMAYGNLAVGRIEVNMYMGDQFHGKHAINLVVMEDDRVLMLEPQKSFTWDPKSPETGWSGLTKQEIYRLEF